MADSKYPVTPEYCYAVMQYLSDVSAAMGVSPSQDVQMGLLGLAAKLESEQMMKLADDVEFGKFQAETLVSYRLQVDRLAGMADKAENRSQMDIIVRAVRRIKEHAERLIWKMAGIEV